MTEHDALIDAAKLQADLERSTMALDTNWLKFDIPGDKLNPNPRFRKHAYLFARADPAVGNELTWQVRRSPAERDEALTKHCRMRWPSSPSPTCRSMRPPLA